MLSKNAKKNLTNNKLIPFRSESSTFVVPKKMLSRNKSDSPCWIATFDIFTLVAFENSASEVANDFTAENSCTGNPVHGNQLILSFGFVKIVA